MSGCGYTLVDKDGEEYPCDRDATSWRWYQDVEHEDCLSPACERHENDGGVRLHRAEAEVDRLGRELTARGRHDLVDRDAEDPMDVYDRQMDNDFNSLDEDGVLDDLANDYRGVDDTAQGRGEQP